MNAGNTLSAWLRALPERARGAGESESRLDLIGLDMAATRKKRRDTAWVPVVATIVLGGLLLVGLRMDVVRMRYAAAEAVALENQLLDEQRAMTVDLLRLREPTLLAEHAHKLGFATPDRVIHLPAKASVDATPERRP